LCAASTDKSNEKQKREKKLQVFNNFSISEKLYRGDGNIDCGFQFYGAIFWHF